MYGVEGMKAIHAKLNEIDQKNLKKIRESVGVSNDTEALRVALHYAANRGVTQ